MFSPNAKLDAESIKVLNAVDGGKFPLLVSRMAQGMQVSDKGDAFSKEELLKLESSLELDEQSLKQLLDSITLVLTQAAFSMSQAAALKEQLLASGVSGEKADAFCDVWNSSAKQIVESLKQRLTKPQQLADVKWSLGSTISSKNQAELKIPHATLQFDLKKDGENLEPIVAQFDHQQLFNLHEQLQQIQEKLDSLK